MCAESPQTVCNQKILLIVTGSVAAYKAIELTSLLIKAGHQVQVLLSRAALSFVGEAAFEALSGRPVLSNLWQSGDLLGHIHWIRWADLIVVAPATAEFIAHLAQGRAPDYANTLSLAHQRDKPFFIFPAMNPSMWRHPATQANVQRLRESGYFLITPEVGFMACGEEGIGRLMPPEHIMEVLFSKAWQVDRSKAPQALITSGGTRVPIDGVRHLGNFSSGQTGWLLCLELLRLGYQVDWIHAPWSWGEPDTRIHLYESHGFLRRFAFETPEDLEQHLKSLLSQQASSTTHYAQLWHLAAISDFHVDVYPTLESTKEFNAQQELSSQHTLATTKLDSKHSYLIQLRPRSKTLQMISDYVHPTTSLVAWKLTYRGEGDQYVRDEVNKLFAYSSVSYVVHNDMSDYKRGKRQFFIYSRQSPTSPISKADSINLLAQELVSLCLKPDTTKPTNNSSTNKG